jgi:hypothetical protein
VFDGMQYIIGFPESIEKRRTKFGITDFNGDSLGYITPQKYRTYGLMPLFEYRFIDNKENCLGLLRQRKPGPVILHQPTLDIFGPFEDTRGRIEFRGDIRNKATGTIHYGQHALFDISNSKIAWSEPYSINTGFSRDFYTAQFKQIQAKGLDFKTPEGRTIATMRDSKGPPGCQIDLFPPIADVLPILGLVFHVFF